ncbi:hypothetical protein OG216_24540 [Streptomycetaceae bacterium NBC_01309]
MLLPPNWREAELIEVVRITAPDKLWRSPCLVGEDVDIWDGPGVQKALTLITDLPTGERYRCFVPAWGIRAHDATHQLFEIAFCFRCHAAQLWGPGLTKEQLGQTFDGDSSPAQELLSLFRACLPSL